MDTIAAESGAGDWKALLNDWRYDVRALFLEKSASAFSQRLARTEVQLALLPQPFLASFVQSFGGNMQGPVALCASSTEEAFSEGEKADYSLKDLFQRTATLWNALLVERISFEAPVESVSYGAF